METYRYWSKECIKDYHRYFSLKWLEYDVRGILSDYHLKRRYVETKASKRLSIFWKYKLG